jgi:hypothetical protein
MKFFKKKSSVCIYFDVMLSTSKRKDSLKLRMQFATKSMTISTHLSSLLVNTLICVFLTNLSIFVIRADTILPDPAPSFDASIPATIEEV